MSGAQQRLADTEVVHKFFEVAIAQLFEAPPNFLDFGGRLFSREIVILIP